MKIFVDLWSDRLLTDREPFWVHREQDALTYLIINHPYLRERVAYVEQAAINAYPNTWREEDLLIHFAGCWYFSFHEYITEITG